MENSIIDKDIITEKELLDALREGLGIQVKNLDSYLQQCGIYFEQKYQGRYVLTERGRAYNRGNGLWSPFVLYHLTDDKHVIPLWMKLNKK